MTQSGKTLSTKGGAIWKGTQTHNGLLLKIHEHAYTVGYSALLSPDGTQASKVKYGDGVFYDAKQKNNRAYVGAPTVSNAVAKFAGIVAREPAVASGYPAINDEVSHFQKGMLVKEGFVIYKNIPVVTSTSHSAVGERKNAFDNGTIGDVLIVSSSDGAVYLAPDANAKVANTDVVVGKVVELNPDDKSVTVYISPAFYA